MKRFIRYIVDKKLIIIYWAALITLALSFRYWLHDSDYLAVDLLRTDFYDKATIYQFTTTIFLSLVIVSVLPVSFMMIFTAFSKSKVYGASVIRFIWREPIAKIANLESLVFLCISNIVIAYACLAYNFFTGLVSTFMFSLIFVILLSGHLLRAFLHTEKLENRMKKYLDTRLADSLNRGMDGETAPFFIFELFAHTRESIFAYDLIALQKNFYVITEYFGVMLQDEKDKENSILFMNYYSCMEGLLEDLANSKLVLESIRYTDDVLTAITKYSAALQSDDAETEYAERLEKRFRAFIQALEIGLDRGNFLFQELKYSGNEENLNDELK